MESIVMDQEFISRDQRVLVVSLPSSIKLTWTPYLWRLRSEAAVCSTGGSTLETGHSQDRPWWREVVNTWCEEIFL
ncbi:hypothetical protein CgunFtcFv8_020205 [Champsocephalus gunnari]|uniref:Uncharacterized protein n=1 Tax=Champsocephalus gunnari TaxID=52237 RepID=A0AAN8E6T2_CHAGU|nr:hypothetical protein CgunFtcFv8_020205 [Champsocephalus gunnari]